MINRSQAGTEIISLDIIKPYELISWPWPLIFPHGLTQPYKSRGKPKNRFPLSMKKELWTVLYSISA
jgi:hypothetical protein